MKKAMVLLLAFSFLVVWGGLSPAMAGETPDFSECAALRDEKAYGKKYEDYMYLLQGKDGWFFRTKQDLRMEFKADEDSRALFGKLITALKEKGTELVIAFPPPRGIAASAFLPKANEPLMKGYDPEVARENYRKFIQAMNEAGIRIVGVPDVKAEDAFFYKTDMHWTTAGAKKMALAVTEIMKKLPDYESLRKTEFVTSPAPDGLNEGHYNEALKALCGKEAPKEKAVQERTEPREKGGDKTTLFKDQPVPEVVLVGTSNSNREDFDLNFSGSLKQALSADVFNAAIAGGGIDDSMLAYLSSDMYRKTPAKFIIWEIPGYYNLNGEAAADALNQIIPAIYGDCKKPLAESAPIVLDGKEVSLLDGLNGKRLESGKFYLSLSFDKPALKKFKIVITGADGEEKTFKFSGSRNPDNKSFFHAPDTEGAAPASIAIQVTDEIKGYKAKVKLCAMP